MAEQVVYFIEAAGRIKIGTTGNFPRRLQQMARNSPFDIATIAEVPGDFKLEQDVHSALGPYRIRGEWFVDCPGVRDVIRSVISGTFRLGPRAPSGPSRVGVLIVRTRARWGKRSAQELMRLTGSSQRAVYGWLSGESEMGGEAALILKEVLDKLDSVDAEVPTKIAA